METVLKSYCAALLVGLVLITGCRQAPSEPGPASFATPLPTPDRVAQEALLRELRPQLYWVTPEAGREHDLTLGRLQPVYELSDEFLAGHVELATPGAIAPAVGYWYAPILQNGRAVGTAKILEPHGDDYTAIVLGPSVAAQLASLDPSATLLAGDGYPEVVLAGGEITPVGHIAELYDGGYISGTLTVDEFSRLARRGHSAWVDHQPSQREIMLKGLWYVLGGPVVLYGGALVLLAVLGLGYRLLVRARHRPA